MLAKHVGEGERAFMRHGTRMPPTCLQCCTETTADTPGLQRAVARALRKESVFYVGVERSAELPIRKAVPAILGRFGNTLLDRVL